jgi:hypothetical protein
MSTNLVSPNNQSSPKSSGIELTSPNADNLIKSKTHVVKNNYWNDRHEQILKNLQMNSNKLYVEYQKSHLIYKKKLRLYRIPIIVMSSLSGFLSISNSGYVPASYNKWVSMFVGFVNLMVTVISLIENFKKIDVNMNKTYSAYLEFKKLHDEISMVLSTPQNEREDNGYDMANTFFSRYEMYLNDAPILGKTLHDHMDINSPDNTTVTVNYSGTASKSPDESSTSSLEEEEMYTEAEYNIAVDDLEAQAQKRLKYKKLKNQSLKKISKTVRQNKSVISGIASFFGFGGDEQEVKVDSMRDNLNSLKSTVRNSGRYLTKSTDANELDKNIFIKKKEMQRKAAEAVRKASKTANKTIRKIENDIEEGEVNSNVMRLEEEIKKLDDLELKPAKLPILRNIKISEDLNTENESSKNSSQSNKQNNLDGKNSSKNLTSYDPDYIEIVGDLDEDSESEK